jgi:hypothetical protein
LAAIIPPKIILLLLTKAVLVTLSIAIRRSLEEKRLVKIVLTHFKVVEVVFSVTWGHLCEVLFLCLLLSFIFRSPLLKTF